MSAAPPELLAALEVERLRGALRSARRAMIREVRELRHPNGTRIGFDAAHRLSLAVDAADDARMAAPPPDLGPLRELVVAAKLSGADWQLERAVAAVLAAYPCLGEE